jgi:hypothetical protein
MTHTSARVGTKAASVSLVSRAAPTKTPDATSQRSERSLSARHNASERAAPSASSRAAFEKVAARTTTPGQSRKVSAPLNAASGASGTTRRASTHANTTVTPSSSAPRARRAVSLSSWLLGTAYTGVAATYASGG